MKRNTNPEPTEPTEPDPAHGSPRTDRPRDADTDNTCQHHKRGDLCGDCGYGMYGFDTSEYDGYCD